MFQDKTEHWRECNKFHIIVLHGRSCSVWTVKLFSTHNMYFFWYLSFSCQIHSNNTPFCISPLNISTIKRNIKTFQQHCCCNSRFYRGINYIFVHLGCYVEYICIYFPRFRTIYCSHLQGSSSIELHDHKIQKVSK